MYTLHLGGPRHRQLLAIDNNVRNIEHVDGHYRLVPFCVRGIQMDAMVWFPRSGGPMPDPLTELKAAIDDARMLVAAVS